ncbi:MAG: group 1 glycosyl transferase [Candidatus Levybacteria bacterium]|nr:group 1 glycosyl transferase [Candidatus Levybacteria bacterium]
MVYDRLTKWGGAERVLLALHKLFPSAPLYTSVYDKEKTSWALRFGSGQAKIKTSFLQKFPFASSNHELFAVLMPIAFESFSFDDFDLVISVTSEAAKGIITKPQTKHICYCLTPTRYLWSGYNEYFKNPILRILSKPVVWCLRFWDKIAAQRPDEYIAISKEVQERISKYYGRKSDVIYPSIGLDAGKWNLEAGTLKLENRSSIHAQTSSVKSLASSFKSQASNDYFLIVSRLVPYKKIDLAVKAFNKLKLPLKIIGIGSEMGRLKAMAGPTIEFLGNLIDKELARYYNECQALVFPGIEDFGLTILEAQSFGKPVIAFRAGGALETIVEGKTGIFFDEPNVESLIKAIRQFNNTKFDPKDCRKQAGKFSFKTFEKQFMKEILRLMPKDDINNKL